MFLKIQHNDCENIINIDKIENIIVYNDTIIIVLGRTTHSLKVSPNLTQQAFDNLKKDIELLSMSTFKAKGLTF